MSRGLGQPKRVSREGESKMALYKQDDARTAPDAKLSDSTTSRRRDAGDEKGVPDSEVHGTLSAADFEIMQALHSVLPGGLPAMRLGLLDTADEVDDDTVGDHAPQLIREGRAHHDRPIDGDESPGEVSEEEI